MARSKRVFTGVGMLPDLPAVSVSEGQSLTPIQVTFITDTIRNLLRAFNGLISLGDGSNSSQSGNIDGHTKEVTFVSANTDYEVPHGLGRVPIGLIVLDVNADGAVVRGGSQGSWSVDRIFTRCNVAGTTARFVIV
jgi:hypothetical protein